MPTIDDLFRDLIEPETTTVAPPQEEYAPPPAAPTGGTSIDEIFSDLLEPEPEITAPEIAEREPPPVSETPIITTPEMPEMPEYAPTSTMEITEPTEIKGAAPKPDALPTPAYPLKLGEKTAAHIHRTLAAGKRLIAPSIERSAIFQPTQEKRTARAKKAVEYMGEAAIHGKAAEYLEPTWYTSEKINERIEKIRGQDPNLANSFAMGDILGAAEIAVTNAAMSGDRTALNIALETVKNAREAAGEFQAKREDRKSLTGKAANVLEAVAGMAPMMGKGAALNAVPIVGPLLSTSMWAKQGAGDIIAELKEKGAPDDVALAYGLAGGLAYSLVERIQIGQALNPAVKKAIANSVKKKIAIIAKEKGLDWIKQVGEEGVQRFVTENTIINALKASGIEVSREEMKDRYKKAFTEDVAQGAMPMLIISALGFGAGAGRVAYASKVQGPLTEIVDEKTGEVKPLYGAKPLGEGPAEYRSLAEFGMTIDQFKSLPKEDQYNIAQELSPEERQRVLRPEGPLTEIVDEKTGEVRPLGEIPGGIKPKEAFKTLADLGITDEKFKSLPKEEQLDIARYLSPEEQQRALGTEVEMPAADMTLDGFGMTVDDYNDLSEDEQYGVSLRLSPEENQRIAAEKKKKPIKEVEQQAKEAIAPTPPAPPQKPAEGEALIPVKVSRQQRKRGDVESGMYSKTELEQQIEDVNQRYEEKPTKKQVSEDLGISREEAGKVINNSRFVEKKPATAQEPKPTAAIADTESEMYKAGVEYGKDPSVEKIPEFKSSQERMDFWTSATNTMNEIEKGKPQETPPIIQPAPPAKQPAQKEAARQPKTTLKFIGHTVESFGKLPASEREMIFDQLTDSEQDKVIDALIAEEEPVESKNLQALREKITGIKSATELQPVIDEMSKSEVNRIIGKLPTVDLTNISQEEADEIIKKAREDIAKTRTGKAQITGTKYDTQKGQDIASDLGDITFKGIIPGEKATGKKISPPRLEFYDQESKSNFSVNANTATTHSVLMAKHKNRLKVFAETKKQEKEAKRGLQRQTETETKIAEKPKQTIKKKEVPSAKETGEAIGETGREEGVERGEEGRIRVRNYAQNRLETKTGKDIKTPKGVTAKVSNIPKNSNLKDEKSYEPVLSLDKKPTGWIRPKNNKSVLIDPSSRKQVIFKATKPEEATAKAKVNTAATGHAINNPLTVEEGTKREPTGKISREAPVSPAAITEGKVPKTEEKKEVTGEVTERGKQAPEAKKGPEEKPKFAKGKEKEPAAAEKREVTPQEKELTDIVYSGVNKDPKYGTIQIVDDVSPESEMGVIGKTIEETTGKKVVFIKTNDRSLKPALGFTVDGLSLPRATKGTFKDTIFVNVDSTRPVMWTAYHEFAHFLDSNPEYNKRFWGAVKLTDKGMAELAKEGQSELTADIIGEMMSRQDFWNNLSKQNKTAAQKIIQEFLRIVNKIRNSIRNLMASDKIIEAEKPLYEDLLEDATAARDALARIYSDYRKATEKKVPAKITMVAKGEKVAFAKKKEKKLSVRQEPLNPFAKVEDFELSKSKKKPTETALSAEAKAKQNDAEQKKVYKSFLKGWQETKDFVGTQIFDRAYKAKRLLGNTELAKKTIGLLNSTKGYSANAAMQFKNAADEITRNLPYRLEKPLDYYIMMKRIVEIEKLKGEGEVKHPAGITLEEAQAYIDHIDNNIDKGDALAIKIAAARYWKLIQSQLKQLRDAEIISEKVYQKLKTEGRHYSPRMFIEHIDPDTDMITPGGRRISVRESGIQRLAKGSEGAMLSNWRLLASEVVASTQSRIFKNNAVKSLGNFVKENPDNVFGGEIEISGEKIDMMEAEDEVKELQGSLLKLQQAYEKAKTGGRRLNIKKQINAITKELDLWTKRIEIAQEQGEETVFITSTEQPEKPEGKERLYFRENGETKTILVDKDFAESWNNNDVAINHTLAQFLNLTLGGALVRPFATGVFAPEFAVTNVVRDMALQWIGTQEYSNFAPLAVVQNLNNFRKVFGDAWYGKGRYKDYVEQGGGMDYLNQDGTFLRKDPTKALTPLSTRYTKTVGAMKHLQEFSERLSRLALREQAISNGKSPEEATRIAREYLDFAQGGSLVKGLDNAIPYLNASVQGTRTVLRAATNKESRAAFWGLKVPQLIMMGAAIAMIVNKYRRKESDETSDREKVSRWNFPLGMSFINELGEEQHLYLSIPKDQSSRIWATIGETIMDRYMGAIDGETAFKRVRMAFDDLSPIDMMGVGLIPPLISAIAGYAYNINFWKEDKIWKGREDISPYLETYKGRTPKAYEDLAEKLHEIKIPLSPEKLNQSMQQVMPKSLLSSAMGATYEAATAALSKEDKLELDKMVFQHWSQYPFVRKYIRATYPNKTDQDKLNEKIEDYGISRTNDKGQRKSETMLKHEIAKKERQLNDIRQQHDNEFRVISELYKAGRNLSAKKQETELLNVAPEKLREILKETVSGEEKLTNEVNRIQKKFDDLKEKLYAEKKARRKNLSR